MHPSGMIALRHLLMNDAAAGRHPLHIAGVDHAVVADTVPVRHGSGQRVSDRLDSPVWMPRESQPCARERPLFSRGQFRSLCLDTRQRPPHPVSSNALVVIEGRLPDCRQFENNSPVRDLQDRREDVG